LGFNDVVLSCRRALRLGPLLTIALGAVLMAASTVIGVFNARLLGLPMVGAGVFGMNLGMVAPLMTLMLHVIYGAVLGGVFAALQSWEHDTDTPLLERSSSLRR
jgi:hypothetical protein